VGFRWTARALASQFSVTGFVRNLSTGDVEVVVEGEEGQVAAFLAAIDESPLGAGISDRQVEWSEARGEFAGFGIRL